MSTHPTTVDPMTRLLHALGAVRRGRGRPPRPPAVPGGVGKDFSAVPVCGSVRPLAGQRARRHLTT